MDGAKVSACLTIDEERAGTGRGGARAVVVLRVAVRFERAEVGREECREGEVEVTMAGGDSTAETGAAKVVGNVLVITTVPCALLQYTTRDCCCDL